MSIIFTFNAFYSTHSNGYNNANILIRMVYFSITIYTVSNTDTGAGGYLSLHDEKTYPSYLFIEAQGMKMYMILGLCRLANKRSI